MTETAERPTGSARPTHPPRDAARRVSDVRETLSSERHLWLSTAQGGSPHLVPLAYVWDGTDLLCATKRSHRSVRNLLASGRARAAVGSARDVVLIDASVTVIDPGALSAELVAAFDGLPLNPARVPGVALVRLRPERILAWREMSEMPDRVVMTDGTWVTDDDSNHPSRRSS